MRGAIDLDPQDILATWAKMPAEQEPLLQAEFTEVGVGIARCDKGEGYYSLLFARPR